MADIRTLTVPADTGSEQLKRLTDSYNALLELLGVFMDDMVAATADATVIAAAQAVLDAVEVDAAEVVAIGRSQDIHVRPARAVTS